MSFKRVVTPVKKELPNVVYVDRDGMYGDVNSLIIVRLSDLGEDGKEKFEHAKDNERDLFRWAVSEVVSSGIHLKSIEVSESGMVHTSQDEGK